MHSTIKINRALGTVLATLLVGAVSLSAAQPKLLLGIFIDGLDGETLDLLSPYLKDGGFKRLYNGGVVLENVDYGTNLDAPAATAMLLSGASPKVSGIGSRRVYDPAGRRTQSVFHDENALGNFTDEQMSPGALKVSTINDEARIAGAGVTYVHALAPTAEQALAMGGHSGNSAIWFNENTGNWATTTYYRETPQIALNANRSHSLAGRIDTMQWVPSGDTPRAASLNLPDHLTRYPFRYTFNTRDNDKYARFASSPLMNTEITDLATAYIRDLELGKHEGVDVLNLAYNLTPYPYTKTAENRFERYDSYVKLNADLVRLFDTVDKTVGSENAVIFIAASPVTEKRRKDEEKWNIPGGEFSSRKAVSLINLYLIALHGNGDWVKAYNDRHFYLNDELANRLDKDINQLRRQTAEFLVRMAGVGHAYTVDDIISADPMVPNALGQSQNTIVTQSGDVIIDLLPGWTLVDDFNSNVPSEGTVYAYAPPTSLFMIKAPQTQAKRIDTVVDARAIAPAIAGMLHIRSPNGASVPPVSLK